MYLNIYVDYIGKRRRKQMENILFIKQLIIMSVGIRIQKVKQKKQIKIRTRVHVMYTPRKMKDRDYI